MTADTISETSLARLSDHEWQILSNTWARGVDWYVQKIGRKWTPWRQLRQPIKPKN